MIDEKVDIVILDDHGLVLEGLKSILEDMPQIASIHTTSSGEELKKLLKFKTFHIYILDIEFGGDINGFDLIRLIRAEDKKARIIVNTMHEEIWVVSKLMQCHANAIILKTSDTRQIKRAILAVMEGKAYYCPRFEKMRKKFLEKYGEKKNQDVPTPRELEVLKAISEGLSTGEISEKLYISENTVETYRKSLMLKFGAKNATDLVMKALANGYLTISI